MPPDVSPLATTRVGDSNPRNAPASTLGLVPSCATGCGCSSGAKDAAGVWLWVVSISVALKMELHAFSRWRNTCCYHTMTTTSSLLMMVLLCSHHRGRHPPLAEMEWAALLLWKREYPFPS